MTSLYTLLRVRLILFVQASWPGACTETTSYKVYSVGGSCTKMGQSAWGYYYGVKTLNSRIIWTKITVK